MTTGAVQSPLPGLDGALIPGPVFFYLTLVGNPQHKERARARIAYPKGGKPFIHMYTPSDTEKFEAVLKQAAALKMRGREPSIMPLCMLVVADKAIPKSWTKDEKQGAVDGRVLPTSKPDWDNHGKITDALTGVVWEDDAQVVDARVVKRYAAVPALTIEVREFIPPNRNYPR